MIPMDLVYLPGGEFDMGSDMFEDEKPRHRVTIKPFAIGKYPVTQAQWIKVVDTDPSYYKGQMHPVECVSWDLVHVFLSWLGDGFRLPTEAEWEYAARGGTTTEYSFGDNESKLGEYAWFDENSDGKTHRVGQKKPNPFGLYDMHGNVWEWCSDDWHDDYTGATTDGSAWVDTHRDTPRIADRVIRGGSWGAGRSGCRSAFRTMRGPSYRSNYLGFRVVWTGC